MSLKTLLRNLSRLSSWEVFNHPGWLAQAGGTSLADSMDTPGQKKPAENVLMVYACVIARREAIGSVPVKLMEGDDKEVAGGPLKSLLARPNSTMTWGQYVRALETNLALYNSFAVWKSRQDSSARIQATPDELIVLSPSGLKPRYGIHDPTGTPILREWEYVDPTTAQQRIFKPEELIMAQGYNPYAPLSTLAPTVAMKTSIAQDISSRESNLALQQHDGTPNLILEGPQGSKFSKEQAEEIQDQFATRYGGYRNRGKPVVTWGGLVAKPMGISPRDMEYLAGLRFLRTDYYIAFRVAPAMVWDMLGETGLSQGSSTDEQYVRWWENVGASELQLIAETHQQSLVAPYNWGPQNIELSFDMNAIPALIRHRLAKTDQAVKYIEKGWRPDDINEALGIGLPPHPDNIGRVAFSAQQIGDGAGDEDQGDEGQPSPRHALPRTRDGRGSEMLGELEALVRGLSGQERAAKRKRVDTFMAAQNKFAAKKISRFYIEQRGRVLARLEKIQRALSDEILTQIFPRDEEDMALVARLTPMWQTMAQAGADFAAKELDLAPTLTVDASPALQKAIERRQLKGVNINATTADDLKRIIAQTFEEGGSTAQLGDAIAEYYREQAVGENAPRTQVAANTETTAIINDTAMIEAREVGGLKKTWIHGNPEVARESHVAAEARYAAGIPLDDKFEIDGLECDAPGDDVLPPDQVCNCTCMVGFVKA